jgi:dihydrofolate reductase
VIGAFRIIAHAIVSADGMIADANGVQPPSLQLEADKRYFQTSLDKVDVVLHGRHSHEGHPNSATRRRLILTRRVAAVAPDPDDPKARLWNPAGAPLKDACAALGVDSGTVAVIGGPRAYTLFLKLGYDVFHLSRAAMVRLPGGLPVFDRSLFDGDPDAALSAAGLKVSVVHRLDDQVTVFDWTPGA